MQKSHRPDVPFIRLKGVLRVSALRLSGARNPIETAAAFVKLRGLRLAPSLLIRSNYRGEGFMNAFDTDPLAATFVDPTAPQTDIGPPRAAVSGWDPYDVWRTRILMERIESDRNQAAEQPVLVPRVRRRLALIWMSFFGRSAS
jgi:hypothetical protein